MLRSPFLLDTPAVISFSGGRTSGYMLYRILKAFGGKLPKGIKVIFCNTGKERTETLDFVEMCLQRWGVEIVWLEYRRDVSKPIIVKGGNGQPSYGRHSYAVVNYETASRNGEPFDAIIEAISEFRAEAKNGDPLLPGVRQRYCTAELKIRTMARYLSDIGFPLDYQDAVGLRADEPQRVARSKNQPHGKEVVYPLYTAGVTESDVMSFWSAQPFDLKLRQHEGNCDLCYLKSGAKIRGIIRENPELAKWWIEAETKTGKTFRTDRPRYAVQLQLAQRATLFDDVPEDDELSIACHCTD